MATIDIFKYETDVIDFQAEQHIFEEGEHGETMYVVQRGRWMCSFTGTSRKH
ncbi:MAG: hypothetical protein ACLFN9_17825 [Desulfococcaceae bacterium]